ncbi:MAG: Trk system potassium transporter TrkA [Treponema sp.]|nr:Trk system potassium transporter TrkA [Treponema sp.]
MKIIIIGAGFTGTQLAKRLIAEKNDVVLIDSDEKTVRHASNRLDCMVVQAKGNSLQVLEEAGISKADALIALTESDELNMITCSMVDSVYPKVKKIARVRNYDYYADAVNAQAGQCRLYGIDEMVHPDVEATRAIVSAVEHGAVTDVIQFNNSSYELTCITVEKGSRLSGVAVQNIRKMTSKKFLLAFLERETKATLPIGSTVLEAGDRIGILTEKNNLSEFFELCGSKMIELKKIILVGAGRIGTIIAEQLIQKKSQNVIEKLFGIRKKNNQRFVIVDNDDNRAKIASEKFPEAIVYNFDITEEGFIEEESLQNYDLVITATNNHELNMVTAAYLKNMGISKTICLVANESYAAIARKLDIDVAIPIKNAVVDTIMSHLRGSGVSAVHSVSDGNLEIAEVEIPVNSKITGKPLREIAVPGAFLAMLIHKAQTEAYIIPDGNTTIDAGDKIIMIIECEQSRQILEMLGVT